MRLIICDICGQRITAERESSDLKGFKDLCGTCYKGLLIVKSLVKKHGQITFSHLAIMLKKGDS